MILNIETSSKICSVALSHEGEVVFSLSSEEEMNHAAELAPFAQRCLAELKRRELKLDAVAVSIGPGSYTGLRIGLSLAKGLCFGLNIPLITVNTLEILAVKAMFSIGLFDENLVFIPMIDARRMEVYTAAYNLKMEQLLPPQPLILNEDSFSLFAADTVVMVGDGVSKAKEILKIRAEEYVDCYPMATDMVALSEKAFRKKEFADLAYSTPFYLKNFQATTPKKNIIC